MKTLGTFALLIASIGFAVVSPSAAAATDKATLSKAELKTLLQTAKTPADHRALASYYQQKAQAFLASSAKHSAEAEFRAKYPGLDGNNGLAYGLWANHCRLLASSDRESAKKAETLTSLHEDMAKKAELNAGQNQQVSFLK